MHLGARGMSAALSNQDRLASEQTPFGEQILVRGVTPITPRDRLAIRANAPMEPRKPQRPADHGLFDTNARSQIEMF
jgi:hypothetical protein